MEKEDAIFVSIPSYRDPELVPTIQDLFLKARHPRLLLVGVYQQNDIEQDDQSCFAEFAMMGTVFESQVFVKTVDYRQARGPIRARAVIEQELWPMANNKDVYFLQIDSHMRFIQDFDVVLLEELSRCASSKPALTTYPLDYERNKDISNVVRAKPTFLRLRAFHERTGFPEQERTSLLNQATDPVPSLFLAAGFYFTRSAAHKEVPYDPYLQLSFLGEELSLAARLYTYGWDLFAPTRNIVFHMASRTYRPVFWDLHYRLPGVGPLPEEERLALRQLETQSDQRLKDLLNGKPIEPPEYGMGHVRTLEQFWEYTGINLPQRQAKRHTRLGLTRNADATERWVKCSNSATAAAATNAVTEKNKQNAKSQVKQAYPTRSTAFTIY